MQKPTKVIAILLTFLCVFSCKQKQPTPQISSAILGEYVSSHMADNIDPRQAIRVRFTKSVSPAESFPVEVDSDLYKLTPQVNGSAVWEDAVTFRFKPDEYFEPDTDYKIWFNKDALFGDRANKLEELSFGFHAMPNYLTVRFAPPKPDLENDESYVINGTVKSSIPVVKKNLDKLLNIQFAGKPKITWISEEGDLLQKVEISNLSRKQDARPVEISWDGRVLNSLQKGEQHFTIPSLNEFSIVNVEVQDGGSKQIVVSFSDHLNSSQNIDGLITLNNSNKQFKSERKNNQLFIYPNNSLTGNFNLKIAENIQGKNNQTLDKLNSFDLSFEDLKPQIKLAGKGVILPHDENVVFPFEYVNVKAVTVEIFQVFESNVMQFLQYSDLNSNWGMDPVGRIVKKARIDLKWDDGQKNTWQRTGIDLSSLTDLAPGSLYQIRLAYYLKDAFTQCKNEIVKLSSASSEESLQSVMQYNYNYPGFDYSQVDDPCFPAYYSSQRFVQRNILASNIGMVAKGNGKDNLTVILQDLKSVAPMSNVDVMVYDFQQQLITQSKTNAQGMCELTTERKPFFVIANKGGEKGYLKLGGPTMRSVSEFDVNGISSSDGFKGFIYGEREVWRPGDTIFLNFILGGEEFKKGDLHPVTCTLFNARGQEQYKQTQSTPVGPIYSFYIPTQSQDLTGNWRAVVKIGGATFTKYLKVETIMPNRLKIKYDTDAPITAYKKNNSLQLVSNWLHGAPAKNLRSKVEMQLTTAPTKFDKYSKFKFTDPTRFANSRVNTIFEGALDADGKATVKIPSAEKQNMPGMMNARIKTRVFEEGGAFSSDQYSTTYHPFQSYTGIQLPRTRWGSKRLTLNKENNVQTVLVDKDGNALANKKLFVGIYESEWRWWWDRSDRAMAQFSSGVHNGAFHKDTVFTDQNGMASINVRPENYGSYLIRVCDPESGHCTGDFYYAGRSWGGDENKNAAVKLAFTKDKNEYDINDRVTLTIPSAAGSVINVSLENNQGLVKYERLIAEGDVTTYSFEPTPEMLPNVYAHVDMVQPHNHGENDLPLRMYGVLPVKIMDQTTILNPVISMSDKLAPKEVFEIKIAENNKQPMAYTIAVVDEGLLDLTRAKTPDPHNYFYAKEALGMNTWDIYDMVLNNYGGQVDRMMSIGGGVGSAQGEGVQEANRFRPVVMHAGPFYLEKGGKASHTFQMPNYVGSVRAMVIAGDGKKYGHDEKTIPVKKPLMLLATMPRKISPGEVVSLPVNVFAMEDNIKNVTVRLKTAGNIKVLGSAEKSISFNEVGDQLIYFSVAATDNIGIGSITVEGLSGREEASQTIELNVLNPNPFISEVTEVEIASGVNKSFNQTPIGMTGTQEAMLEVYGIYPFSIEKRMKYLLRYPYGCLEQTTSAAFPQLYVGSLMEMDANKQARIQLNVNAALKKIKKYARPNGSFSYWPGTNHYNDWSNTYVGHFMLEAKEKGYYVDQTMFDRWKSYQQKEAQSFNYSKYKKREGYWSHLNQAYRLYLLAKGGDPEFGAMNRFKTDHKTEDLGTALLAAAYALAGQSDVANELIGNFENNISTYDQPGWTFGSDTRDRAILVEAYLAMGNREKAAPILRRISEQLDRNRWMSTQSTAFSLLALSKFYDGALDSEIQFTYTTSDGNQEIIKSEKPIYQIPLEIVNGRYQIDVKNLGGQPLFTRVIRRGRPVEPITESKRENIKMVVRYTDMKGKLIDHTNLQQGTDFIAEVRISNPGTLRNRINEMALQQIFPSGWEIVNQRMDNFKDALKSSSADYQDYRDDRVYTFFDIARNSPLIFKVALNAAYEGRYLLPAVQCEAMYDHSIQAIEPGRWVEVVKPNELASN